MGATLEGVVEQARTGDQAALETLVREVQDQVYGLALRMLAHPADAEDASQEILIKVITNLGSFRGESSFATWVYRVAANHLLTTRQRRAELRARTFSQHEELVEQWSGVQPKPSSAGPEQRLLEREMRHWCLHAMLLCLDRPQRLAYLLGEVLELNGKEAGYILEISPATYRQRLARARERMRSFMSSNCGWIREDNPCTCSLALTAVGRGKLGAGWSKYSALPQRGQLDSEELYQRLQQAPELGRVAALFRSQPQYQAPGSFLERLKQTLAP